MKTPLLWYNTAVVRKCDTCFHFCSATTVVTNVPDELKSAAKSRRKNRNKKASGNVPVGGNQTESEWTSMSPKSLWKQIKDEAEAYFKFSLDSDNGIDNLCEVSFPYQLKNHPVTFVHSQCMHNTINFKVNFSHQLVMENSNE